MLELREFVKLQKYVNEYVELDGGTHVFRIAKYTSVILHHMDCTTEYSGYVGLAAALHDIGKLFIDRDILEKPAKLSAEEFEIVKTHSIQGFNLMGPLRSNFFQSAAEIALNHHENWDGSGYPHGIKGNQIPFNARVVAVIDVFDSLVHKRVYKDSWSIKEAMEYIHDQSGKKFDPEIIAHFDKSVAHLAGIVELDQQRDIDEAAAKDSA